MSNTKTLHGLRSKEHISLESAITRCKEHFDNKFAKIDEDGN
jgi:hypothetical protein